MPDGGAERARMGTLDGFLLRPPTPPKESDKISTGPIAAISGIPNDATGSPLPSPRGSSPTSSAESTNTKQKKRVEFSPYNQYHAPIPPKTMDSNPPPTLLRTLSSSAIAGKPSKSILKP